jgi:hypothetical protein
MAEDSEMKVLQQFERNIIKRQRAEAEGILQPRVEKNVMTGPAFTMAN